jgi:cytochrome c-type biogenesis protein
VIADTAARLAEWWAPFLAFVAGAVSFASPCVFPLVPGYISFISGGAVRGPVDPRARLLPMLLFVAGFTVVFTLFGAFASTFVRLLRGTTGQLVAGGVVVAMGLVMIGYTFERGSVALYAERRPFLRRARPGVWGAFPLGMAFATGWTPCIGPVLAGILAIAGSQDTARGTLLLVCYSLGLGVPFLLVGFGIQRLLGAFGWVRRNYRWIATGSGLLLVTVGVLIATGLFTRWLAPLASRAPAL